MGIFRGLHLQALAVRESLGGTEGNVFESRSDGLQGLGWTRSSLPIFIGVGNPSSEGPVEWR